MTVAAADVAIVDRVITGDQAVSTDGRNFVISSVRPADHSWFESVIQRRSAPRAPLSSDSICAAAVEAL